MPRLLSTGAGNLHLTGSLAEIIAVQRATDGGLGLVEHAGMGWPTTEHLRAAALLWFGSGTG